MEMIRRYGWFILLLAVGATVLLGRIIKPPIRVDEPFFTFDTAALYELSLSRGTDTIAFYRSSGGAWRLASGETANSAKVRRLIDMLSGMLVAAPVPDRKVNAVCTFLDTMGYTLRVVTSHSTRVVRLGRYHPLNNRIVAGSASRCQPVLLEIPESSGKLTSLFVFDHSYWHGIGLFSFPFDEVRAIGVENCEVPSASFLLDSIRTDTPVMITRNSGRPVRPDRHIYRNFLYLLTHPPVIPPDSGDTVSVGNLKLFRVLVAVADSVRVDSVKLYRIRVHGLTNDIGIPLEYDPNVLIIQRSDGMWLKANYLDLSPILLLSSDLLPKTGK